MMDTSFIQKLRDAIANADLSVTPETIGRVVSVGDGIAEATGLDGAQMAELVIFDDSDEKPLSELINRTETIFGLVLNLEEESVKIVILGDVHRVREGMIARSTGSVFSIPVGESMVGRVVDALGTPVDGKGPLHTTERVLVEREAYGVVDRQSVHQPLMTGIKAIDAMIPIGRGQRELIIGDRFTGKTTIAVDTIINQKNEPRETRPICIYVAIGQKESKVARLVSELSEKGALEYSIVVTAPASAPASLQFIAPFSGAAIGEYFMDRGKDALIIYDDLSKHAVAYREISLLLRRPPGREAYPGDIFYLHSRLLERAAKLSAAKGGGSLTALPIIETQENDVSAYIPTNVISITDGQIYLTTDLFNKGIRPAVDVGISVSRVGSSAQTKAMKKVAGRLRLELAQYYELEAFAQFASDLDPETKARLEKGQRMVEALKQGKGNPLPLEAQVVILYAGINGYLDTVPVSRIREFEEKFIAYLEREEASLLLGIRDSRTLDETSEEKLKTMLVSFKEAHPDLSVVS